MTPVALLDEPSTAVFSQTITVAGFEIEEFNRSEHSGFCFCSKFDVFGNRIRYLICVTSNDSFTEEEIDDAKHQAAADSRSLILVAKLRSSFTLSWNEFLDALGGAVPTWRALNDTYAADVVTLASNQLPIGLTGEAWLLFEEAVADGFEFILGRRVRRLGGKRRGQDVPDAICLTSDRAVLVLDAKASGGDFSATKAELRPLEDYVRSQQTRQNGHPPVGAAVLIARQFRQDASSLLEECGRFQADTGTPLSLLTVTCLLEMIQLAKDNPTLRNAISWRQIFCRSGLTDSTLLDREFRRARDSRVALDQH